MKYIYDEDILAIYFESLGHIISIKGMDLLTFARIKKIDDVLNDKNGYDQLLEFYKELTNNYNTVKDDYSALMWIEYIEGLIICNDTNYHSKYYEILFNLIILSSRKFETLKKDLFSWAKYEVFVEYRKSFSKILYNSIKFNRPNYVLSLLEKVNEIFCEINKHELNKQKELFEIYKQAFVFSSKSEQNEKNIAIVIDCFKELFKEIDKKDCISKSLFELIVQTIRIIIENQIDYDKAGITDLLSIYYDMLDENNNYRIQNKENICYICKVLNEIAFYAAERNKVEVVNYVSNFIGWKVKKLFDSNDTNEAMKMFKKGFKLFDMLIKIEFDKSSINFVATFVATIIAFCYANQNRRMFGEKMIALLNEKHIDYIRKAITLREPLIETWDKQLSCDFSLGLKTLKSKLSTLI